MYRLKIDFFFFYPERRLTGRQVGVWIEGRGELVEEGGVVSSTKADERSLLAQ